MREKVGTGMFVGVGVKTGWAGYGQRLGVGKEARCGWRFVRGLKFA